MEGYGRPEGTSVSTCNPVHGHRRAGSVGLPLNGQEIRIVDDNGTDLATGQDGEEDGLRDRAHRTAGAVVSRVFGQRRQSTRAPDFDSCGGEVVA
ncbi:hypothetical protein R4282_31990 [Rhodococcus oxybenzonivorans]|uniref:hypothetical protein n=1 Tax=Rhodococcus oxybenzonivorans TaxID=1990687 RepID=UPI0029546281|nr:hypothetical protein [Rhodococcus oxybenzonivorans]MDV7357617.1 hypothetical protein [Rhodococcus oxybenzonivorans]